MSLYDDYLKTKSTKPATPEPDASSAIDNTSSQSSGGLYAEFQASKQKSASSESQPNQSVITPEVQQAIDKIQVPQKQLGESFILEQQSTKGGFVGWLENGGLWQYAQKVPGLKSLDRLGASVVQGVGSVLGSVEELGGTILDNTVGRLVDKATGTPYTPTSPVITKASEELKNNINRTMGSNDKAFGNEVIDTIGGFIPWIYGGDELKGATTAGKIAPLVANLGMSGVQSLMAAQQDYKQSIDAGKTKGQATLNSLGVFGATLATNYVAHKLGFFANPESGSVTKAVGSWLKTIAIEDVSLGGVQTMISNVSQGRAPLEGVGHNMLVNLPAIALFSGVGEIENHSQRVKAESQVKDFLNKVHDSGGSLDDAVKLMATITGQDEVSIKSKIDGILEKDAELKTKFDEAKSKKDAEEITNISEQFKQEAEFAPEESQPETVPLADVTSELIDAGYSKQDISRMTADLYRENPEGNFTREQVDNVKQDYLPKIKDIVTITKDLQDKGYTENEVKQIVTELHKAKPDADFTNADVNVETQKLKGEDLYNIKAEEEALQKSKQEKEAIKQQKIQEKEKAQQEKEAEKERIAQEKADEKERLAKEKQNFKDKVRAKKIDIEKREATAKVKEIEAKIKEIEARIKKMELNKEKIDAQIKKTKLKETRDVLRARSNNIKAMINKMRTRIDIKSENLQGLNERIKVINKKMTDSEVKKVFVDNENTIDPTTGKYKFDSKEEVEKFVQENNSPRKSDVIGEPFYINQTTLDHLYGKDRTPSDIKRRTKLFGAGLEIAETTGKLVSIDKISGEKNGIVYYEIIGKDPELPKSIIRVKISEKNKNGKAYFTVSEISVGAPVPETSSSDRRPGRLTASDINTDIVPQKEPKSQESALERNRTSNRLVRTEPLNPLSYENKENIPSNKESSQKVEKNTEIKGKFAQRLQEFLNEGSGKNIPDAERRTWIEEGKKFQEIVEKNPERIGAILRGDEPLPEGMTPGVFIKQAALYLKDNPDIDLMSDFANNVLQGQISEAARITASGRAISNDTFTKNIKKAQTAVKRGTSEKILEKRKNAIVEEGKNILDENTKNETLDEFLDENLC